MVKRTAKSGACRWLAKRSSRDCHLDITAPAKADEIRRGVPRRQDPGGHVPRHLESVDRGAQGNIRSALRGGIISCRRRVDDKEKEPMTDRKHHEDGRSHEIDFSDPQVTDAWLVEVDTELDESDRQALAEEISRQFRQYPAGVPSSGIESELERTQERLSWVLQQLETQESPEVRSQVGQLRERFVKDIESLKKRINELQLEDPES
jgi:hypothetical protein